MQTSLKIDTRHSQYLLLTINKPSQNSNHQETDTNSLKTLEENKQNEEEKREVNFKEQGKEFVMGGYKCCQCERWRQWAVAQQFILVQLEKQLIDKQMKMGQVIERLTTNLMKKCRQLQEKCHQIADQQQKLKQLETEFNIMKQAQKLSQLSNINTSTAQKQKQYVQITLSTISKSKEEPIINSIQSQTCPTTMLKQTENMKNKLMETADTKFGCNGNRTFHRTNFQNQILKDYNSALLERLHASKLRKYF